MTLYRAALCLLALAIGANAQTQVDFLSQVKNKNGYIVNSTGVNGGYIDFPPVLYNPYASGTVCFDYGHNIVTQPVPANAQPAFGPNDVLLWNTTSPSMPFAAGTGAGLVQRVLSTNPPSTNTGPCGIPLPVNTLYGLSTNGYIIARGGLSTDNPQFDGIQALQGGMTANSYTAGVLYPIGTVTTTGTLVAPAYLGGHVDTGHSASAPASAALTAPAAAGASAFLVNFAGGITGAAPSPTRITFEDATPETVTVASGYVLGNLSVTTTTPLAFSHAATVLVAWEGGAISAVSNPFSNGEGLVAGQIYWDDTLGCERAFSGTVWACIGAGAGSGSSFGSANWVQYAGLTPGTFAATGSFTFNPATGQMLITGVPTSGVDAPAFSSTNTGTNPAFTDVGANFMITGAGNAAFQGLALTNGWTAGSGAYGLTGGGALTVASCTGCGAGTSFGSANWIQYAGVSAGSFAATSSFTFNPSTGVQTIVGATTSGVDAPAFSSTNTGSNVAYTDVGANFTITGAGNAAFQGLALQNGLTAGAGAYGLTAGGALTVASCTGCGSGSGSAGSVNWIQYAGASAGSFAASSAFTFNPSTNVMQIGGTPTSGVQAAAFSSINTGSNVAFTDISANFAITGGGDGSFQNLAAAAGFNLIVNSALSTANVIQNIGSGQALLVAAASNVFSATFTDGGGTCRIGFASGGVVCPSDVRLKDNVKRLDTTLNQVMKLRPVGFDWKKGGSHADGLIAQEVQQIFPGAVHVGEDGFLNLSYQQLIPYMIRAIQEEQYEITALKAKVK